MCICTGCQYTTVSENRNDGPCLAACVFPIRVVENTSVLMYRCDRVACSHFDTATTSPLDRATTNSPQLSPHTSGSVRRWDLSNEHQCTSEISSNTTNWCMRQHILHSLVVGLIACLLAGVWQLYGREEGMTSFSESNRQAWK